MFKGVTRQPNLIVIIISHSTLFPPHQCTHSQKISICFFREQGTLSGRKELMTKCARPRNKKKQSALENFAMSQKGFLETQTFFYSLNKSIHQLKWPDINLQDLIKGNIGEAGTMHQIPDYSSAAANFRSKIRSSNLDNEKHQDSSPNGTLLTKK